MSDNIPPLKSLRAFEAVARLGSMVHAAQELNISPSSITQHVKKLEEHVGVALLERTSNSIALTERGRDYFYTIRPAFDIISHATSGLTNSEDETSLSVSCAPSFLGPWFAELVDEFKSRNRDAQIHIDFASTLVTFDKDTVDLSIRYGKGSYPDADSQLLFIDYIAPVCSKQTADNIKSMGDFLKVERLESTTLAPNGQSLWSWWAEQQHEEEIASKINGNGSTTFQSSNFAIEALKIGNSLAMLEYNTVREQLKNGHLVSPLDLWVSSPHGYYILSPKRRRQKKIAKAFRATLVKKIEQIKYIN